MSVCLSVLSFFIFFSGGILIRPPSIPQLQQVQLRYSPDGHCSFSSAFEEEEHRLSKQHGKAANGDAFAAANCNPGPRTQAANTTLIKEDAATARELEETVQPNKKAVRPLPQTSGLKGAGGLLFVRWSFPRKREKEDNVASTAAPTAEEDNGTEATALEANHKTESHKGSVTQEN